MSAVEETKPTTIAAPAGSVIDPTPAAPAIESTETPVAPVTDVPATETQTEAPVDAITADTPAAVTDAVPEEVKEEKKPVEPIYSGALSYQVHHSGLEGSIKGIFQSPKNRYFWFGEDAPITTQHLNSYLRGEKPKASHPAAAWSNKTGKGLLYFVKHADEKSTPAGVLPLADVTDIVESPGITEFSFKLDGAKHVFQTKTADERSGWVLALKKISEEAKASKESILGSPEYKEAMDKLNKPVTAGLAATGAAAPKTHADKPTNGVTTETPEEVKKENKTPKSRSVSRGKRASIFGNILGKKDEVEEKHEVKKEERKAEKEQAKEEPIAPVVAAPEASTPAVATEPVEETPAPVAAPVVAPTETPAAEHQPEDAKEELAKAAAAPASKAGKRGSIFGQFFDKVRSPTTEKKESDVAPPVPAKEEPLADTNKDLPAAPAAETPTVVEPMPAATETAPIAIPGATNKKEDKPEEKKLGSSTPKESFFGKLKARADKVRSPSSERAPVLAKDTQAEPTKEESPIVPEAAPAAEPAPITTDATKLEETAAVVDEPKTNGVHADRPAIEPTEKRRSSFFGSIKKDHKEGEAKESNRLSGIFRNPSKLIKGQKEGKKASAPAKVDEESSKVSDEAPKLDEPEASKPMSEEIKADEASKEQPQAIGDVVPEAVTVGQPAVSTPTVSATA